MNNTTNNNTINRQIQPIATRNQNNSRNQDTFSSNIFMNKIFKHGKAFMFVAAMLLAFFVTQ